MRVMIPFRYSNIMKDQRDKKRDNYEAYSENPVDLKVHLTEPVNDSTHFSPGIIEGESYLLNLLYSFNLL